MLTFPCAVTAPHVEASTDVGMLARREATRIAADLRGVLGAGVVPGANLRTLTLLDLASACRNAETRHGVYAFFGRVRGVPRALYVGSARSRSFLGRAPEHLHPLALGSMADGWGFAALSFALAAKHAELGVDHHVEDTLDLLLQLDAALLLIPTVTGFPKAPGRDPHTEQKRRDFARALERALQASDMLDPLLNGKRTKKWRIQ